ncbi:MULTISPECIES: flavodoxin family protein [unclassified Nocardia]|uniref:flavodoxin family protein n=1 Tax=unclassified Nocardia TaxID=2637762 RepID=UPI001CE3B851|nr:MULTISPECIES: flavodoxin family protein [unclassified Nocardia]
MKALIVCVSVSHGNTRKVADVMGQVLQARVVEPEQVDIAELADYDLIGFGSGIFFQAFHPRLRQFVRSLPEAERGRAFVFTTSGFPPVFRPFVRLVERKGFEVADTFSCRALDTMPPFKLVGGVNKDRPNADDLAAARAFAEGLRARTETAARSS